MNEHETALAGLARLLAWEQAMGVDAITGEEAVAWLDRGARAPGADFVLPVFSAPATDAAGHVSQTAAGSAAPPGRPAVSSISPLAPQRGPQPAFHPPLNVASKPVQRMSPVEAGSLPELEAKLRVFDGCGLKATATNLCFYRGAPTARLMIIGEAPGRDEDLEGRPFVGRAGQLLDKMLASIGLSESQVHITNIVYWRPPGNRTPSPQEALACRPFLECQAQLVAPDVVLLLGGAATKNILGTEDGIMRLRGKWTEISLGGRQVPTMATLHPAYLLRTPASKRQVWRDLLSIKHKLA